MAITRVDVDDDSAIRALWELAWAANSEGRPWHMFPTWPGLKASWQQRSDYQSTEVFATYDAAGRPAGFVYVGLALQDNLATAFVDIAVAGDHRRRGIGHALLDRAADRARELGRTKLMGAAATGLDAESAAELFARREGFTVGQTDAVKVATVADMLTASRRVQEQESSPGGPFILHTFEGRCPDQLVEPLCILVEKFLTLAPMGELEIEPEKFDEPRLREMEQRHEASGRWDCLTIALAEDGGPAGFTELTVAADRPELATQGATVVLPAHRGHRLGARLKARNQLAFLDAQPQVQHVLTGNADENAHMNAINEAFGFRSVERFLELQRVLAP